MTEDPEPPLFENRLSPPKPKHSPTVRLFGALLIAVGGLVAALSGACSTLIFLSVIPSIFGGDLGAAFGMLGLILLFGGPPVAAGVGLYVWGRRLRR